MQVLQLTVLPVAAAVLLLLLVILLVTRLGKRVAFRGDYYVEGLKCLAEGDETRALKNLKLAISENPANLDTFLKLGSLLRRMGRFDKALQIDQQLTVRQGLGKAAKKEVYWSVAQDYIGLERENKAISLLKELTTFDRRDTKILRALLDLYEKTEKWDEALETMRLISELERKDSSLLALYYSWVGTKLLEKGDRKGDSLLKQALRIDGNCVPALLSLGDALYRGGQVEQAIVSWRRVVREVPQYAWLVFDRLEKAYFDQGKFGEVQKIYETLLEREPKNLRALSALARIYEKKGDLDGALEVFNRVLDLDPSSAFATGGLMRVYMERGDSEKAAEHARTLSEVSFPRRETYTCSNCRYISSEYLWYCPQCKEWKTF